MAHGSVDVTDGLTRCREPNVRQRLLVSHCFRRSGFYSTDYGKGKKKPRESETAAAGDKTADKPAEKVSSETKPKPSADAS